MDSKIKEYLRRIGGRGGRAISSSKARAARKNGLLGGRPKLYTEKSAYQAMADVVAGEDWKIAYMNFVDGFRRRPSLSLLKEDPALLHPNMKMYALLQSICIQLCLENELPIKGWLGKKAYLPDPWFVSGMSSLYAMALKESPLAFRRNNIFVMGNFLARV